MEKRKLFIVHSSHYIEQVDVLFEDNKPHPVAYYSEDINDWCRVDESEHFFETDKEAHTYVEERQAYLRAKLLEIKEVLKEYDELCSDASEAVGVDLDDILSGHNYDPTYLRSRKELYENLFEMFASFTRKRMVNIGAHSFPFDDVKLIKWYQVDDESCAELTLADGQKFMTSGEAEYTFVRCVFGYNNSDKIYIRKTKKEGETQDKEARR